MKVSPEYQNPGISYSKIYNKLKRNNLISVQTEVAICVNASLPKEVSPSTFNLLCGYTKYIWDKESFDMNIQVIADIVCDLYLDCGWGYRNRKKHRILKRKDLKELNNRDLIGDIYCERF